jgi:endonuclease YncB( thermonuclease family)
MARGAERRPALCPAMGKRAPGALLLAGLLAASQLQTLAPTAAASPRVPREHGPPERAGGFRATVLSIGDGDTLRVERAGRSLTIRLACIDAPEMAQPPWGEQSRSYLAQRLPRGREVRVIPHTIDRYGRLVAEVISDLSIHLVMVEDGQAFVYHRYLDGCEAKELLEAEFRASRHRYGVWQVPGGITRPWLFRRGRTGASVPDGTTADGRRLRCRDIGSHARAQELLRQGHRHLDGDGDGEACERLR